MGLWPPFKACPLWCEADSGFPTVSPVLIPWLGLVVLRRLAGDDLTAVDECELAPAACAHPPPTRQSSVWFHVEGSLVPDRGNGVLRTVEASTVSIGLPATSILEAVALVASAPPGLDLAAGLPKKLRMS